MTPKNRAARSPQPIPEPSDGSAWMDTTSGARTSTMTGAPTSVKRRALRRRAVLLTDGTGLLLDLRQPGECPSDFLQKVDLAGEVSSAGGGWLSRIGERRAAGKFVVDGGGQGGGFDSGCGLGVGHAVLPGERLGVRGDVGPKVPAQREAAVPDLDDAAMQAELQISKAEQVPRRGGGGGQRDAGARFVQRCPQGAQPPIGAVGLNARPQRRQDGAGDSEHGQDGGQGL